MKIIPFFLKFSRDTLEFFRELSFAAPFLKSEGKEPKQPNKVKPSSMSKIHLSLSSLRLETKFHDADNHIHLLLELNLANLELSEKSSFSIQTAGLLLLKDDQRHTLARVKAFEVDVWRKVTPSEEHILAL